MLGYDAIVIVLLLLFTLSSKTRVSSCALLFAFLMLYIFALSFYGLHRYAAIGTIEVLIGLLLLHKINDTSIAETMFISTAVNVVGGILYWNYYPPVYYDNMCITVIIIQILILLWRVAEGGVLISRISDLHPVFGAAVSNINKRHSFLFAKKKTCKTLKGFK